MTQPQESFSAEDHLAELNLEKGRNVWRNNHPKIEWIFNKAAAFLKSGMNICEFGVGDAHLMTLATKRGMKYSGLDISSYLIDYHNHNAKLNGLHANFCHEDIACEDGFNLDPQDAVFCLDVLEHVDYEQYKQALENIHSVLRLGGIFVGTVPYEENLEKGLACCPECGCKFHRIGHKQSFDMEKLRNSLEGKFRIERMGVVRPINRAAVYSMIKRQILYPFRRYAPGDTVYFVASRI